MCIHVGFAEGVGGCGVATEKNGGGCYGEDRKRKRERDKDLKNGDVRPAVGELYISSVKKSGDV